eukprot:2984389-Prymnesium_polylepis.1
MRHVSLPRCGAQRCGHRASAMMHAREGLAWVRSWCGRVSARLECAEMSYRAQAAVVSVGGERRSHLMFAQRRLQQIEFGRAAPLIFVQTVPAVRLLFARRDRLRLAVQKVRTGARTDVVGERPHALRRTGVVVARKVAHDPDRWPDARLAGLAGQPEADLEVAALVAEAVPRRELPSEELGAAEPLLAGADHERAVGHLYHARVKERLAICVGVEP